MDRHFRFLSAFYCNLKMKHFGAVVINSKGYSIIIAFIVLFTFNTCAVQSFTNYKLYWNTRQWVLYKNEFLFNILHTSICVQKFFTKCVIVNKPFYFNGEIEWLSPLHFIWSSKTWCACLTNSEILEQSLRENTNRIPFSIELASTSRI